MKVIKEVNNINDLDLWEGAEDTRDKIIDAGKEDEFMELLDDLYPDGADETKLNDYMWFQDDSIFELLDIKEDD